MTNYGTRTTFRVLGAGAGILGVVYLLIHRFYLTKVEKLRLRKSSGKLLWLKFSFSIYKLEI